jgi:hypothetical protein
VPEPHAVPPCRLLPSPLRLDVRYVESEEHGRTRAKEGCDMAITDDDLRKCISAGDVRPLLRAEFRAGNYEDVYDAIQRYYNIAEINRAQARSNLFRQLVALPRTTSSRQAFGRMTCWIGRPNSLSSCSNSGSRARTLGTSSSWIEPCGVERASERRSTSSITRSLALSRPRPRLRPSTKPAVDWFRAATWGESSRLAKASLQPSPTARRSTISLMDP